MKVVKDDGFDYGLGVFETVLVFKGQPVFLKEHLKRLQDGMLFLEIKKNIEESEILFYLAQQSYERKNVLKIIVTDQNTLFEFKDYHYQKEDYLKGFQIAKSTVLRNETSPFTYYKTLNYGDNILEKRLGKKNHIDEPYFLNTVGNITEGATSNIFFIKNNQIYTPPKSAGILPGIVREWMLKEYSIVEKNISTREISEFDEIFLTNSLLGIMPVRSIDGIELPSMNFSRKLHQKYEEMIQSLAISNKPFTK